MIKKIFGGLAALLLVLAAVLLVRTLMYTPADGAAVARVEVAVDRDRVARRLAEAIAFQTISHQDPAAMDRAAFDGFNAWLETTYPRAHAAMRRAFVGGLTPLYTWPGSEPALPPVLLTAHYDVVPVAPGSEDQWTHPPFAGTVADGFVWGRGSLDDKSAVVALMEAAEALVGEGFQPKRTLLLSFGHDEEVGGARGAGGVAALLEQKGIRAAFSLDEGSFLLDGFIPGIDRPVANINLAEKGYLTVELIAPGQGGHSSMPPPETAAGILAAAIVRLQRAPFPGGLDGLTAEMFDALGRDMPFARRLLFANRWLFAPVLEAALSGANTTNAILRTTTAPTMLRGSPKENVLPTRAVGTVNFRLHPRDSVDDALAYIKAAIDDPRVEVRVVNANPASPVADPEAAGFKMLAQATRQVFGDVLVAPGLTIAGTDSKHYVKVSDNAYRFNPMVVTSQDIAGIHGSDERLSIDNLAAATAFYTLLMRGALSR